MRYRPVISSTRLIIRQYSTQQPNTNFTSVPTLVSAKWAAANIHKCRVLDCSWYMPSDQRDVYSEYVKHRIPSARKFSIDECSDKSSIYPHMLPPVSQFEYYAAHELGVKETDNILLYDTAGIFSAPRVWLTFHIYGHRGRIFVLDGGIQSWTAEQLPVADGEPKPVPHVHYSSKFNSSMVKNIDDIIDNIQSKQFTVLDARSTARFTGKVSEPRPIPSGHIPNSINIPFSELLSKQHNITTMKPVNELQSLFKAKNIDLDLVKSGQQRITTSCGSGVTASIISLALDRVGIPPQSISLYDGSWSEFAHVGKTNKKAIIETS